jgi:hypothetical protein
VANESTVVVALEHVSQERIDWHGQIRTMRGGSMLEVARP